MIRKRNKIELESSNEASVSNEVNNEAKIIKTYTDLSILALEELEKQGIDIYAEGRFGGMYLRQNKNRELDQKLFDTNRQYISNKADEQAGVNNETADGKIDADTDLINFFQK